MKIIPVLILAGLVVPASAADNTPAPFPATGSAAESPRIAPADGPTASADLQAAKALVERGRFQDALPLAHHAVTADPDSVPARDLLGQVLTRLERPGEAIAELTRAAAADPRNADVFVHLGQAQLTRFALDVAQWKKAHGDNAMLGTITSDIPGAMAGGSFRYAPEGGPVIGETDKASQLTRDPNEARNPRFDPGHSAMGLLRRSVAEMNPKERERFEQPAREALASFGHALELQPDSREALRGQGYALYALGQYPEAAATLEKAANKSDALLYEMAADAYTRADRPNDAIRMWEEVIQLSPTRLAAYQELQTLYASFRKSRWERRYYAAMEKLLRGKPEDALDGLEWVTTHQPDYAPGWRATGSAYLALKDPQQAVDALKKARELDPQNGLTEYELGVALLMGGDTAEARRHLTEAAKLRPDYAPAWYSLGIVADKEKDPDSAIAAYEKALTLRPDWAEAHFNLAALLLDRKEGSRALPHLERYLSLKPDAPDAADVRRVIEQVRAIDNG